MYMSTAFAMVMLLLTGTVTIRCINLHFMKMSASAMMALSALLMSIPLLILEHYRVNSVGDALATTRALLQVFPDILMDCMLGYLLFAAAIEVDLMALARVRMTVFCLAVFGTTCGAFITGVLTWFLVRPIYPLPLIICLLFGAAMSPTDPVAVTSVLNEKPDLIPASTRYFVWCESLFNDAVGVILFYTFKNLMLAGELSAGQITFTFFYIFGREVILGILIGLVLSYLAYLLIDSVSDPVLEVTITIVLVGNIQVICAWVRASVPLASAVAGLFIGNYGTHFAMTPESKEGFHLLWKFIDETLNSILTLLIGLMNLFFTNKHLSLSQYAYVSIGIVPISLFSRAVSIILGLGILVGLETLFGVRLRHPHVRYRGGTIAVLTWGGLRGAITIALALGIVRQLSEVHPTKSSTDGQVIFAMTYAIVVFSIVVQGLFFEQACELIQLASYKYLKHGGLSTMKSTHSLFGDKAEEPYMDDSGEDEAKDEPAADSSIIDLINHVAIYSEEGDDLAQRRKTSPDLDPEGPAIARRYSSDVAQGARRRRGNGEPTHIRDESITFQNLASLQPIPPFRDVIASISPWRQRQTGQSRDSDFYMGRNASTNELVNERSRLLRREQ